MTQSGVTERMIRGIREKLWQLDPAQPGRYFRLDEPRNHFISLSNEIQEPGLSYLFPVTVDNTVIHIYVGLGNGPVEA